MGYIHHRALLCFPAVHVPVAVAYKDDFFAAELVEGLDMEFAEEQTNQHHGVPNVDDLLV